MCGCVGAAHQGSEIRAKLSWDRGDCQNDLAHSTSKRHLSGQTGFGELASLREKLLVHGCQELWKTLKTGSWNECVCP